MEIDMGAILQFLSEHKLWFAALIPFVLAVAVIKLRG